MGTYDERIGIVSEIRHSSIDVRHRSWCIERRAMGPRDLPRPPSLGAKRPSSRQLASFLLAAPGNLNLLTITLEQQCEMTLRSRQVRRSSVVVSRGAAATASALFECSSAVVVVVVFIFSFNTSVVSVIDDGYRRCRSKTDSWFGKAGTATCRPCRCALWLERDHFVDDDHAKSSTPRATNIVTPRCGGLPGCRDRGQLRNRANGRGRGRS